jgi:diguanylate cyclase (GGDEF)-like protein
MLFANWLHRLWPLSIRAYAVALVVFLSLGFSLLDLSYWTRMNEIRSHAQERNLQAGKEEFARVIRHIVGEVTQRAKIIADQDETRQQLANPAYYGYWRDSRALGSGSLTDYTQALEIYTLQGRVLADSPINNMPAQLAQPNFGNYLTYQGNRYYLYVFQPIPPGDSKQGSAEGYLGFKIDFLAALKEEQYFSHVDPASIRLRIDPNEQLPQAQIPSRLTFSLQPNPESEALIDVIAQFRQSAIFVLVILSLVIFFALNTLLAIPLRRLSLHIDTLREGHGGLLTEDFSDSLPVAELEKVRESLNDYQHKLETMNRSLNEKNDELWLQAHHDPLTGIYNRRCFEEDWEYVMSVATGHRLSVSFLLFDCDHFKPINDTYGHQVGDQVIQAITHSLQTALRQGDRLYRLGGDEFATIFLDTPPNFAVQAAERCIDSVSHFDFTSLGIKEPVRISVGISHSQGDDAEALATLPKQADIAMYHAKRPSKHKIAVYDDSMTNDASILFSTQINSAVFEAIHSGEALEMHYQPVVDLTTGAVAYYEALVRIRDKQELIMPSAIFPVVEARRLESELDLAVIGRIELDLARGTIPPDTGISLNVSGPGIINPQVLGKLLALGRHLDSYQLVIEVTETALITQLRQASTNLNKLRQAGFQIALDDFGSGYSSLGYLSNMPVDIVKFDISMVRHLDANTRQSIIVENLALMIFKAGYNLVAEGIETEQTLRKVAQIGFSRGQGYLFGRPDKVCREAAKLTFFEHTY